MSLSRFHFGVRPWQAAAALLIAAAVFLAQAHRAEAAIGVTVNLTATTAGAATDMSIAILLDTGLNAPGDTIVITFPVGWTVPDSADLSASVSWAGLQDFAPTISSQAGARTITTTLNNPSPLAIPYTLTIANTAGLTNPGAGAHTITVDATGNAQGVSAPFNITAPPTAVTGVTISAAPLTAGAASTATVVFTPSAAGALAAGNTITVVMTGYTFAAAPIAITPTGGFVGALTGVGNGGSTVTVTLAGGASLAALTQGTFTFPVTNPGAGAIAAAGLTVATSQDTTAVQSSAGITIVGAPTAVTGVTISAAPLTAGAASTVTVLFTPSAAGALAAGNTITVVMTGYTFAAAPIAITPLGAFAGGLTGVGNGGNTVTVTLAGGASLAALAQGSFSFPATNPGAGAIAAAGLTVATSQDTTAVQSSAGITITPPATAVTGVGISAGPMIESSATTVTVTFTPSAAGALAAGNTITVVMTGYTFAAAPIAITPTGGFVGGLTGVGNGGSTVTVTLAGGASLAALNVGIFSFPATNPAAQTIPAAGLTVATSQDTTAVQSSAGITITAQQQQQNDPDPGPGGGGPPIFFPVTCNPGSYNDNGTCVEAPPGSFVALSGASSPTLCVPGTYQNLSGMSFCFAVSDGTFTSTAGATSATPWTVCPTGQVQVTAGTATSDRVCGQSPAPKLTALALVPLNAAGTLDVNVPFSDWPRASLTGGQTTFTLTVESGRSYGVGAEADSGEITYRRGGINFDPATTRLAAGDTVTIQAANSAGTSPTHTLTLSGSAIPQLTGAAILLSSNTANVTGVTTTITFNSPVAIPAGGKIKVTLPGFAWPGTPTATFTSPSALGNTASFAGGTLTVALPGGASAGSTVTFTATGATLPAAQTARTDVRFEVTNSADTVLASTSTGTMPAIVAGGTATKVAFTTQPVGAAPATAFTTQPVVTIQDAAGNRVTTATDTVALAIKTGTGTLTCSSTRVAAVAGVATFAGCQIDTAGDFTIEATTGTLIAATSNTITVGGAPQLTALTLVPTQAGSARITVPVVAGQTTYEVDVPPYSAADRGPRYNLSATMSDPAAPVKVLAFGLQWDPTLIAFQSGESATFTATGSSGTSPTYTIRLRAGASPLTNAAVTLSPSTANATGVTTRITFNSPVAIPIGGKIKVTLTGFTWPGAPVVAFVSGHGTATATATFASNTLTVTTATSSISAGTVTLDVTGATLPAAQAAKTDVRFEVTNSADTVLASTSTGTMPAITAAPTLAVTLSAPSTASTGGTITASASVIGAAGQAVTYAWAATPAATCAAPSTSAAQITLTVTGSGTCTISVTATAGTDSANASAVVTIAGTARLEFVTQPQDSTTGSADINLSVRAVKADGTVDSAFNNQVQLTIQGGGSSFGLGSVTAVNGVATFSRTYNPSRADVTWTLRATQISGRAAGVYAPATSSEFRVTRPPTLRFTTQPVGGTAGAALTTQPVVTAYNADGTVNPTFTGTVTLTLKSDTANGATLTSTATAAVAGRATFSGASVNNAGTGYVLVASATGYATVASEAFNVTSAVTKIVITQYTSTFTVGRESDIEVRAEARDADDRIVPGAAGQLGLILMRLLQEGNTRTERIATSPSRVEGGVAIFGGDIRFSDAGDYRWGVDDRSGSGILRRAETDAFKVTKTAGKLAFVQQPGGFGPVLGTQPIVEIQDEDGNRIPGATNEVTLTFLATNDTDPIMTGGARRAATAGRVTYTAVGFTGGTARPGATFTITASATGLTSATSASFGPAGPTTKLVFTSDLPCGLVARPGCSPAAKAGQQFTITVAAQDASGQVNPNEAGLVTLTGDGNSGMTARNAPFVQGVATFAGVRFNSASATGYTLTATSGALTVASGRIVVTADNTPASLRFTAAPTHEVSESVFTTQPQVEVLNAAGQRVTAATGNIVLSLHKQDGTTVSLLTGDLARRPVAGVAEFSGLKVAAADTGLYLKATLGTLEANQTGTFRVYADAASATVARSSEQSQSKQFSLKLNIDSSIGSSSRSTLASGIKSDLCQALSLDAADCARISVTTVSSSSVMAIDEHGRVLAVANVEAIDTSELVSIGGLNLRTFEAETGATAPAGTSALYGVARIAVDAYRNRLETLSAPRSFSLPVPESAVLPGTRPGDLKVAWWDDAARRWVLVPTRGVVNPDGSFTVTATTDALGAFAVLYAPGASRIEGPGVFSADGAGFGVFVGGSTGALAHAAGLNDATGVWVQDAAGNYRLLVVGGPAFLADEFASRFPGGIGPSTAVTLVRPAAAPGGTVTAAGATPASTVQATAPAVTSTGAVSTYTVTASDTLSGIAARFGVDQTRLAAANNIAGPAFVVRTGQVLTIPTAGGASTYTVTGTDTLSGIGVRFGVDWMRIAEANGIAGPNYLVRAGQTLTIPR